MFKTLVIFGATGHQGGSIIRHVLADAELSAQYSIRAVTRDPSSASSQALQKQNVEVVKANLNDLTSVHAALKGAHTVFLMGAPDLGPNGKEIEIEQGKAAADAAVAAGVQYLIYSTLPNVSKISGGKYTKVAWFDCKAIVEEYIRTLPIQSAFYAPGSFMQNFNGNAMPQPAGDGAYALFRPIPAQARIPMVDIAGDTGKYVGAILAAPDRYAGAVFCGASALYSQDEVVAAMAASTGKVIRYQQISEETFRSYLPPHVTPQMADFMFEMMSFQAEFGYFGPQTEELVKWAVKNARGKVHNLEDYLRENPLELM